MTDVRLSIAGATGWTGRAIVDGALAAPDITLTSAIARDTAGEDLGTALGREPLGVRVHGTVAEALEGPFTKHINPASLEVLKGAKVEPGLATAAAGARFQFERVGYFCVDKIDSKPGALVFNRTIQLKDGWAKAQKQSGK